MLQRSKPEEIIDLPVAEKPETLQEYYSVFQKKMLPELECKDMHCSHFNVFIRGNCFQTLPFRRRDYYKVNLCKGKAVLFTGKGEMEIDKPALFFSNPLYKFGWRNISKDQDGFVCIFNDLYITADLKQEFQKLNKILTDEIYPVIQLTEEQYALFYEYFSNMSKESHSDSPFKEQIIQNLLRLIVLTAMKVHFEGHPDRQSKKEPSLVTRFMDMLDAQFPVDSPVHAIALKTPADFADQLHVHVNHLNHIVREYTGKTTSQLIAEKRWGESLSLLKNTDWTIAEIGYSLGFDYPQHFNAFFKKLSGKNPKSYRLSFPAHI
jgi:AraC-like DNA-binding protein